jgi:16S rRNA (uracil1498-N3)-methyltransferase
VPVLTDRTVKLNINPERINRIIKEAAEQSGRGILPKLENPVSLAQIGQHSGGNDLNIFFEKSRVLFMDWIIENGELLKKTSKIGIFIGPEGGWTKEEIEIAKTNNYHIISLGNFVLRAETAAIIASYLLVNS